MMRIGLRLILLVLCHLALGAPGADAGEKQAPAPHGADHMVTTSTGLAYVDLEVGEGRPAANGDMAIVHYTGWLRDGTKFDSSLDRGEPFSFRVGSDMVIKGWNEGVRSMRPGGTRRLIIPPHLAYGKRGVGDIIPPNATLTFEVTLLELR